ncbi:LADA_0A03554g1_1 [Lachancea dasiensis]|uniref:LADA_0A03554g1_1 n=1 Tax=Lachancea dasiensis TaxID=1072105 RepID=A0A1G4INL7_9SACH|nr:LADA_0A03554g1_1 [Lachancea dasiensis]
MTSVATVHKVPEFYCCYLLRSVPKKQSFYIGSTPNPVRRLRQHNGDLSNGSAYRTKRAGLRPWEMVACVYGFTSKIAALQFEHAWQHSYQTHFIKDERRLVKNKAGGRSLHHKLGVIRLLIENAFFSRMDLKIHFFDPEAVKVWDQDRFNIGGEVIKTVSDLGLGTCDEHHVENLIHVELFFRNVLAPDQMRIAQQLALLAHGEISCRVCQVTFNYVSDDQDENQKRELQCNEERSSPLVAFCPMEKCDFVSHLRCLHRIFLDDERLENGTVSLIPKSGDCPSCEKSILWTSVVRYSTWLRDSNDRRCED